MLYPTTTTITTTMRVFLFLKFLAYTTLKRDNIITYAVYICLYVYLIILCFSLYIFVVGKSSRVRKNL